MPFGMDVGNSIDVRWEAAFVEVCTTLSSNGDFDPLADVIISAIAMLATLAGIAYEQTRPALAILIPTAFPYTSTTGPPH